MVVVAKLGDQGLRSSIYLHSVSYTPDKEAECAKSMSRFLYGSVNVGTLDISSTVCGKEIM